MVRALLLVALLYVAAYTIDRKLNRVQFIGGFLPFVGWKSVWMNEHTKVTGLWFMWWWRAIAWRPTVTMYGETDEKD